VTLDLAGPLVRPLVYLITRGECESGNYIVTSRQILDIVSAAVDAGIDLIQIREKKLTGKLLFELTQRAAGITRDSTTRLLVNDRVDIALAAGVDGVHLTSSSISADVVRRHVSDDFVIGVSCHSVEDVRAAAEARADLALFGPVFPSPGKGKGMGRDALAEACRAAGHLPVLAIGGIDAANCRSVIEAGASGAAAIRALNDPDPMRHFLEGLRG